ncbi:MAG: molybdopterin molybdotransferase MoeA [Armatimonadetes bacterium]|nr:molybdopterin molybdotransferase MoeA [Armatimonadota bacterium]
MLSYDDALRTVLEHAPALTPGPVPLTECLGRALAVDVSADQDDPPYRRSAMDGYAVRSTDLGGAPVPLACVDYLPAGQPSLCVIGTGECARIMTGGIVPEGADTVVMVEDTQDLAGDRVLVRRAPPPGANVCRQGENFRAGSRLLAAGTTIGPAQAALLATVGLDPVPVVGLPRVAHVTTGDEVVPASCTPRLGQVRDSNSVGLASILTSVGVAVRSLGISPDDPAALEELARVGLESDVCLISAGVSKGDRDFVPEVLERLGVELLFRTVAIKPGKPTLFGVRGATLVFGLPGNPVAAQVVARVLVVPALEQLGGHTARRSRPVTAALAGPLSHKPGRRSFVPATVTCEAGQLHAHPVPHRGSGDMLGLASANALVVLAEDRAEWQIGDLAPVVLEESW